MGFLLTLLAVGLAVFSIYSVLSFRAKRQGAKKNLLDLERGPFCRQLSTRELACLQPYLVAGGLPTFFNPPGNSPTSTPLIGTLTSHNVYRLNGGYHSYLLSMSGSAHVEFLRRELGGVEIVFPYGAENFLQNYNEAEVVVTTNVAVVIRLNQEFDIASAFARTVAQHNPDAFQWPPVETDSAAPEDAPAYPFACTVRVRQETPIEMATRRQTAWQPREIWSVPFLAVTFALLAIAGENTTYFLPLMLSIMLSTGLFFGIVLWTMLVPRSRSRVKSVSISLLATGLSCWMLSADMGAFSFLPIGAFLLCSMLLFWHHKTGEAKDVLCLQGLALSLGIPRLFLGAQYPIVLPKHWQKQGSIAAGDRLKIEMRAEDFSVLRFGDRSLEEDERRCPSARYWPHVVWALIAALSLTLSWFSPYALQDDLDLLRLGVKAFVPTNFKDAPTLLEHPPKAGDFVALSTQARCQLVPPLSSAPEISCAKVRWGGLPLAIEAIPLPSSLFVYTLPENDQRSRPFDLAGFSLALKAECLASPSWQNSAQECATIQQRIGALVLGDERQEEGFQSLSAQEKEKLEQQAWQKIIEYAERKELDKMPKLNDSEVRQLQVLARQWLAEGSLSDVYKKHLPSLLASQRGGLVLSLSPDTFVSWQRSAAGRKASTFVDPQRFDALDPVTWAAYQNLARPEALMSLDFAGQVISFEKDQHGDWLLEVDPRFSRDKLFAALWRLVAFALAGFVLLTNGTCAVINVCHSALARRSRH